MSETLTLDVSPDQEESSNFTPNALETLEKRYLLRNGEGKVIETPDELLRRIAKAVADGETDYTKANAWEPIFYYMMRDLDFLPNTPTIMNAGKENGQLSACFVLPIEDKLAGGGDTIFGTLDHMALIHQTGGGTGFDFSRLRPEGSMVSSKLGVSTGPLSFCKIYDAATDSVKQGASRRGANMMTLRVDHPDILKFIDMKTEKGVMTNFNVSVTVTDRFMEALKNDTDYELTHPFTGRTGSLSARYVWNKIAKNAWKDAEPGLIFIDRVNERSPYWEPIEATNPCGEQPLPAYGSCNLGSINLSNFQGEGKTIDWNRLRDVVQSAVRFLDNVVDVNAYPIPEIEEHTKRYRNIGLGVMGWADLLIQLGIPYGSKESIELGREVMEFVNREGHLYSVELGREKGLPAAAPFKDHYSGYGDNNRRNATVTTVAPTGTLCILAGCSSGIEPNFAFEYEKHVMDTVLTEYHPLYKKALENGAAGDPARLGPEFVDAHGVDSVTHVDMQAAFQEHCDSAISKTINLPEEATVQDVQDAYIRAWDTGCKGITVYRDGSREGVLHRKDEPKTTESGYCTDCGTELIIQEGCESCPICGTSKCSVA